MQYRSTYVLVAILAVSAFLMPAAAAAAQPPSNAASGLSSLAEIERYLTSIGVDFAGVVVQQGSQNYAGPNCPGEGWTCTTASVVVQMGMLNVAEVRDCTDGTVTGGDTCTVVQSQDGGKNMARCFMDTRDVPVASQTCDITQANTTGDNDAEVHLVIRQREGDSQTATQTATITQTSVSGDNRSSVHETIDQDSHGVSVSGVIPQSQQGCQNVDVNQMSTTGSNTSVVHQSQRQSLKTNAPDVDQEQNTSTCTFDDFPTATKNVNATVRQNCPLLLGCPIIPVSSGANRSQIHQLINQDENAPKATGGAQTQGSFSGGLDGLAEQSSFGVSRSVNHQSEMQTQKAKEGVRQEQVGPIFCCTNQLGNDANQFEIDQSSNQQSDGMNTFQDTTLEGQYNTSGDGSIMQRATNNTEKATNDASGTGFQQSFLSCDSSSGEGEPGGDCQFLND